MVMTNPNPTVASLFATIPAGKYSLVVVPNGNGTVSVNPAGNLFASNTPVDITPSVTGTNLFYYWTGSVTNSRNPLHLAIQTNLVIIANFSGGQYLIQLTPPILTGTNVQLQLSGAPLQTYKVEISTNLVDWSFLTERYQPQWLHSHIQYRHE